MPDLIEEFRLPSEGKIYGDIKVNPQGRIRAPRLSDKGIGDSSRKNKIQAGVLNKTILEPGLGIDAYDLHTSDYVTLNLIQRMATRGKYMDLNLICPYCGHTQKITVDLNTVRIKPAKIPLDLSYTTHNDEKVELRFFTPRILDQIKDNTAKFREDFPEADHDISLQETCRALIVSIDGEKLPYSQMTTWLMNCYEVDLTGMVDKVLATNFGPELIKVEKCENPECRKNITYSISPDNG